MSETSTTFLTLTPTTYQMDNLKQAPGPIDHVTLNLAVESLSYHLVSGDTLGPLVNSLKAASIENRTTPSQGNSTPTEQNKAETPPIDDVPTDRVSEPSEEQRIDNQALLPVQNGKQDTVADKHDTVAEKQDPIVTTLPTKFLSPATILKHRLQNTKDLIVCPGVYDGFSARIALSVGFDALYMVGNISSWHFVQAYKLTHPIQTGAGTTASRLGQPDLGLAQLSDMRAHADMIANLDPYGTPVIADMDTGYGGTSPSPPPPPSPPLTQIQAPTPSP